MSQAKVRPMNGGEKGAVGGAIGAGVGAMIAVTLVPTDYIWVVIVAAVVFVAGFLAWYFAMFWKMNLKVQEILKDLHSEQTGMGNRFNYRMRDVKKVEGQRMPMRLAIFITNADFNVKKLAGIQKEWAKVFAGIDWKWDWHVGQGWGEVRAVKKGKMGKSEQVPKFSDKEIGAMKGAVQSQVGGSMSKQKAVRTLVIFGIGVFVLLAAMIVLGVLAGE